MSNLKTTTDQNKLFVNLFSTTNNESLNELSTYVKVTYGNEEVKTYFMLFVFNYNQILFF